MRKAFLDRYQSKWISRKLLVFIIGSVALFRGVLTSTDWVIIATTYMAVQGVKDTVVELFKSKNSSEYGV
jgi:hypothetical protein